MRRCRAAAGAAPARSGAAAHGERSRIHGAPAGRARRPGEPRRSPRRSRPPSARPPPARRKRSSPPSESVGATSITSNASLSSAWSRRITRSRLASPPRTAATSCVSSGGKAAGSTSSKRLARACSSSAFSSDRFGCFGWSQCRTSESGSRADTTPSRARDWTGWPEGFSQGIRSTQLRQTRNRPHFELCGRRRIGCWTLEARRLAAPELGGRCAVIVRASRGCTREGAGE